MWLSRSDVEMLWYNSNTNSTDSTHAWTQSGKQQDADHEDRVKLNLVHDIAAEHEVVLLPHGLARQRSLLGAKEGVSRQTLVDELQEILEEELVAVLELPLEEIPHARPEQHEPNTRTSKNAFRQPQDNETYRSGRSCPSSVVPAGACSTIVASRLLPASAFWPVESGTARSLPFACAGISIRCGSCGASSSASASSSLSSSLESESALPWRFPVPAFRRRFLVLRLRLRTSL